MDGVFRSDTVKSCAMVITDANEFVSEVHDRMPVMVGLIQWLYPLPRIAALTGLRTVLLRQLNHAWLAKYCNTNADVDSDATDFCTDQLTVADMALSTDGHQR
jgi:hypothetical protein